MTTKQIQINLDRLRILEEMYKDLYKYGINNPSLAKDTAVKMKITKDEMIKLTYLIGHNLKEME